MDLESGSEEEKALIAFAAFCFLWPSGFAGRDPEAEAPVVTTLREHGLHRQFWQCGLVHVVKSFSKEQVNAVINILQQHSTAVRDQAQTEGDRVTFPRICQDLLQLIHLQPRHGMQPQGGEGDIHFVDGKSEVASARIPVFLGPQALSLPDIIDVFLFFTDPFDKAVLMRACCTWHHAVSCHVSTFLEPVRDWWASASERMDIGTPSPERQISHGTVVVRVASRRQALRIASCLRIMSPVVPVLLARIHQTQALQVRAACEVDGLRPQMLKELKLRLELLSGICSELNAKLVECERVYSSLSWPRKRGLDLDVMLPLTSFYHAVKAVQRSVSELHEAVRASEVVSKSSCSYDAASSSGTRFPCAHPTSSSWGNFQFDKSSIGARDTSRENVITTSRLGNVGLIRAWHDSLF